MSTLLEKLSHEYMVDKTSGTARQDTESTLLPLLDSQMRGASIAPVPSAVPIVREVNADRASAPVWTTIARTLVVLAVIVLLLYFIYTRDDRTHGGAEQGGAASGTLRDDVALIANWNIDDEGDGVVEDLPASAKDDAAATHISPGDRTAASTVDDGVVDPLFQPL